VEDPRTLYDLVSQHVNDMGYSIGDLSKVLIMNEMELARTYSIDLPSGFTPGGATTSGSCLELVGSP
jgi:hypothetical protein